VKAAAEKIRSGSPGSLSALERRSKLSTMDPVWANTWRRFFGLKARPLPAPAKPYVGAAFDPAPWAASSHPDVDEDTAHRTLAEINSREGHFIDYD
jgi:hypothetical protein